MNTADVVKYDRKDTAQLGGTVGIQTILLYYLTERVNNLA